MNGKKISKGWEFNLFEIKSCTFNQTPKFYGQLVFIGYTAGIHNAYLP